MCSTHSRLLPSLALLLILVVGPIHGGGIGKCNHEGGTCVYVPAFLRVAGDPYCHVVDQIELTEKELDRECGDPKAQCCELGKVQYISKQKCNAGSTPNKCLKAGGLCLNDCNTIKIDGLCKGSSCTCCIQKAEKCKPKTVNDDLDGTCVRRRKYCRKAGGDKVRRGCDCKSGKAHVCYKQVKEFHWSYHGDGAPEFWADHYPLCGLGRQSPIDIISADADLGGGGSVEPFEFTLYNRKPVNIDIFNNGHSATVYWNTAAKPSVDEGGLDSSYILAQFHFHWGSDSTKGSEHLIDGEAFPIELHLVHYKSDYGSLGEAVKYGDGLAVLGVMYKIGKENEALKPIVKALPKIIDADMETEVQYKMDLNGFLPANRNSFYRYLGSLTTPSCNEVVLWTVFKEPLDISEAQLEEFRKIIDDEGHPIVDNFRPPQALNGRTVYEYDG